jgi:hypothetical protein
MRSLGGELVNPLWISHLEQSDGASSATFVTGSLMIDWRSLSLYRLKILTEYVLTTVCPN